jgi:hypothetical protein
MARTTARPSAARQRNAVPREAERPAAESRVAAPAQAYADVAARDSVRVEPVVTTAAPGADAVTQIVRGHVANQKATANPPAAPPTPAAVGGAGRGALSDRPAARRAAAAQARSEEAQRSAVPQLSPRSRIDTVYERSRVDTVVVERPVSGLRQGSAQMERPFPITGCYEVVEGGLPRRLTLTTTPLWSGAAERRFEAHAPGAVGYWSQPRTGDVHVVIAGALITARVDATTGELHGTVRRGRSSQPFHARRCP